jgi:glycerol dehydrogenase-like iron-containing ADH family enzyme
MIMDLIEELYKRDKSHLLGDYFKRLEEERMKIVTEAKHTLEVFTKDIKQLVKRQDSVEKMFDAELAGMEAAKAELESVRTKYEQARAGADIAKEEFEMAKALYDATKEEVNKWKINTRKNMLKIVYALIEEGISMPKALQITNLTEDDILERNDET